MKKLKTLTTTAALVFGLAVTTPAFAATNYSVQSGDTVAKIAVKNEVSSNSIIDVNNITNVYNLQIGQSLVIPSVKQAGLINKAYSLLGTTPYVFGGTTPYKGMDCSGFVQWVYAQNGVTVTRTAQTMWDNDGKYIAVNDLQPGDLIFFTGTDPSRPDVQATHMGIYVGKDQFIEESSTANNVIVAKLWENSYYSAHYLGAKRIVD